MYNTLSEGVKRIHDVTRDRLPKRFPINDDVRSTLSVCYNGCWSDDGGGGTNEEKTMFLKVLFVESK